MYKMTLDTPLTCSYLIYAQNLFAVRGKGTKKFVLV